MQRRAGRSSASSRSNRPLGSLLQPHLDNAAGALATWGIRRPSWAFGDRPFMVYDSMRINQKSCAASLPHCLNAASWLGTGQLRLLCCVYLSVFLLTPECHITTSDALACDLALVSDQRSCTCLYAFLLPIIDIARYRRPTVCSSFPIYLHKLAFCRHGQRQHRLETTASDLLRWHMAI